MSKTTPSIIEANTPTQNPPHKMTYEEYLAWADEDTRAEWVNGEVIVGMPPKHPHQTLVEFLDRLLGLFITIRDLGQLRIAPFELKIRPEGNSIESNKELRP